MTEYNAKFGMVWRYFWHLRMLRVARDTSFIMAKQIVLKYSTPEGQNDEDHK